MITHLILAVVGLVLFFIGYLWMHYDEARSMPGDNINPSHTIIQIIMLILGAYMVVFGCVLWYDDLHPSNDIKPIIGYYK